MTDAHGHGGHNHEPSLDNIVDKEFKLGVQAMHDSTAKVDHAHVIMDGDTPNIDATIKHLQHDISDAIGKYLDKEEPRLKIGYETLSRIINIYDKPVENGHLAKGVREQIEGAVRQMITQYLTEREQIRFSAAAPDDARQAAKNIASETGTSSAYKQIDKAKTGPEIASAAGQALQKKLGELTQYLSLNGSFDGYGTLTPAHGHGH